MGCVGDVLLAFIAIVFPPLPVWIKTGCCTADSCVNILLCLLGWLPGMIHAWYIIARYPEHDYDAIVDPERGGRPGERVTYYYISHRPAGAQDTRIQCAHGYGAVQSNQQQPRYGYQPPQAPPPHPSQHYYNGQQNTTVNTSAAAEGSSSGNPPTYSEAIRGNNKIQRE